MPRAVAGAIDQRGHAHAGVVHVNREGFRDAARVVCTALDHAAHPAGKADVETTAHAVAAMVVWEALTGLTGPRAIDHARMVAAS